MKAFQVFSHGHAPLEPYFGWMQQIRDMAESYTLIAPKNFMGPRVRFVPIEDVWAEIPVYFRERPNGHNQWDPLRARFLATHFDHVYLDIDVELRAPLDIGPVPRFDGPGVMIGNGDPALGLVCWGAYLRMAPAFCRPATLMLSACGRNVGPEEKAFYSHHFARGQYF